MSELKIEEGLIIDNVEAAFEELNRVSGYKLSDFGTVQQFIVREKNTRFYIDTKLNSKMNSDGNAVFVWLDSGIRDGDAPVFIALRKNGKRYSGHFVGTVQSLMGALPDKNREQIRKNAQAFKTKYAKKAAERTNPYIFDERGYLVGNAGESHGGTLADLIRGLNFEFQMDPEEDKEEPEKVKPEPVEEEEPVGKELTIGLLLDKIDEMQSYVDELMAKIDEMNRKSASKDSDIEALRAKNEEYKRAMVQMRTFLVGQEQEEAGRAESKVKEPAHELLDGKIILVVGSGGLGDSQMKGIAKQYGFENGDFEFVTDYEKVVGYAGRLKGPDKYRAVIIGGTPHKVKGLGKATSLLTKLREQYSGIPVVDARSKSHQLKVTKESFRTCLVEIVQKLQA